MHITVASAITAILTALLAAAISVLVQIAVCKCHSKFTHGRAESAVSVEGEGQAVPRGVDHMIGEGGNTLELRKNEAYSAFEANNS